MKQYFGSGFRLIREVKNVGWFSEDIFFLLRTGSDSYVTREERLQTDPITDTENHVSTVSCESGGANCVLGSKR